MNGGIRTHTRSIWILGAKDCQKMQRNTHLANSEQFIKSDNAPQNAMTKRMMDIEVAYATPVLQKIISLHVAVNTSVYDAIKLSDIASFFQNEEIFKDQNIHNAAIGIFGKKIDPNTYILKDKDRIEIYRPLNKTPNQKRLERAHVK